MCVVEDIVEETRKAYDEAEEYMAYADDGIEKSLFNFLSLKNHWDYNDLVTWEAIEEDIIRSGAKRIIDIGCGVGSWVLRIAAHFPDVEVVGIDFSEQQIKRAKKLLEKYPKLKKRVKFKVGDAKALEFADNEFDLSICLHDVLNHIPDYEKAIDEMIRVAARNIVSVHTVGKRTFYICGREKINGWIKKDDILTFTKEDGTLVKMYDHLFTLSELKQAFRNKRVVRKIFGIDIFASQIINECSKVKSTVSEILQKIRALEEAVNGNEAFANNAEHIMLITK